MDIEDIENQELKQFAQDAKEDGWDVTHNGVKLILTNHQFHKEDLKVRWKEGDESWKIANLSNNEFSKTVPKGELDYLDSTFF